MTLQELKFANEVHFAVKGFLIHEWYSEREILEIRDSYVKRLWGNHERLVNCREDFEKAWAERMDTDISYVAVLGYD